MRLMPISYWCVLGWNTFILKKNCHTNSLSLLSKQNENISHYFVNIHMFHTCGPSEVSLVVDEDSCSYCASVSEISPEVNAMINYKLIAMSISFAAVQGHINILFFPL